MTVNEEVYGAKSNWAGIFTASQRNVFVEGCEPLQVAFPTSDGKWSSQLLYAFQSGKLTLNNQIDDSIAMLGVDDGSWLTDRKWSAWGKNTSTGEYLQNKLVCKMKKRGTNPLGFSTLSTYSISNETVYTTSPYTSFWGYNQTYYSNSGNLQARLYSYINVKNTYHVAFVKANNTENLETTVYTDSSTTKTFDLYTYFKALDKNGKHFYESYPNVIALFTFPVYDYRNPPYSASKYYRGSIDGTAKPFILNQFEDTTYPFDDSGKPLQILTYQQGTTSTRDNYFDALKPFSDPTSTIETTYSIDHIPAYIAGNRFLWQSLSQSSTVMYQEYTNIHERHYLDGNVYRILKWLDVVTADNAEEIYNKYMKQVAYLGMFFTDSWDYAVYCPTWDYDRCFCGIIDDNGVAHGEYSAGEKNREQKQWNWESFEDNDYKPSVKPDAPDKEQSSDPYNFTGGNQTGLKMGNFYAITDTQLLNLQNWISKISNPSGSFYRPGVVTPPENMYDPEELAYAIERMFSGVYPVDCILNVMYFPFAIDINSVIAESAIKLGNTITSNISNWFGNDEIPGAFAVPLRNYNMSQYQVIDTQPYLIDEYFYDFRDYQPYTTIELHVPWHGTLSIDPGQWIGHELSTKMIVDIITGSSTTYVMRDGIPTSSIDGQVGATINYNVRNLGDFTSTAIATSQQLAIQKLNNERATINTITSTVQGISIASASAVTGNSIAIAKNAGNLFGTVAGGINSIETGREIVKNMEFNLHHAPSGSTNVSSQSPAVSHYATNELRLVIKRPHLMPGYNSQIYGRTVGFACLINDSIAKFSGYTVFSSADLTGIDATEQEKLMINNMLQSGVIL